MRSANSRPPMKEWQRGSNQGTNQKTAAKSTNKKQVSNRKSRVLKTIIASNENVAESGPPSIAGSAMTDNVTGLGLEKYYHKSRADILSTLNSVLDLGFRDDKVRPH